MMIIMMIDDDVDDDDAMLLMLESKSTSLHTVMGWVQYSNQYSPRKLVHT